MATKASADRPVHRDDHQGYGEPTEGIGGAKRHREGEKVPLIKKKKRMQTTLTKTLPLLPPPPSSHSLITNLGVIPKG